MDIVVNSSCCKAYDVWKSTEGTAQYDVWYKDHQEEYLINRSGRAGKMQIDGIIEMIIRFEEKYGVKYVTYIEDEDSKTFKSICDAQPYKKSGCTKEGTRRPR